jgi:hypothetical protein
MATDEGCTANDEERMGHRYRATIRHLPGGIEETHEHVLMA